MKNLLIALTTLTLGTTAGSLTSILNSEHSKILNLKQTDITPNITEQSTIYIDSNGHRQTTSDRDLFNLDTTEIIQIGFYQIQEGLIQAVRMPKNVEKVPDTLPPQITSLRYMFRGDKAFNHDISKWDTSNVTDMKGMFFDASTFKQNISSWNTSNVTNMDFMFYNATAFNQDISNWKVGKVTDMSSMFYKATAFNHDISKWDTSKVTKMTGMFYDTSAFNQNISNWNTSNVTNMSGMFYGATAFNQDLSNWNVSNVTSWRDFSRGSGIDYNKLPKFGVLNNDNLFEKDYRFLAHDWLKVKISNGTVEKFRDKYSQQTSEFYNYLVSTFNNFPKLDNTGAGGSISQNDIYEVVSVIKKHWDEISEFETKLPNTQGIEIITNTIGSWDKSDYMGVFAQ